MKKIILLLIALIVSTLIIGGFILKLASENNLTLSDNSTNSSNNSTSIMNNTVDNRIIQNKTVETIYKNIYLGVEGPKEAKKGQNVTVKYTIFNKGKKRLYAVRIMGQNIDKSLGTLKPGEKREFISYYHIPTDAEMIEDFGPGSSTLNPFPIGGDALIFKDANRIEYRTNFESIYIKLK